MSESTISIKVADGSFFPVLEPGFTGRKKLTLTTAKDNQNKVQIDLYSGGDASVGDTRYIGSLIIENIPSARQGEPEIELLIGLDSEGQLEAEASEKETGESQRFSTSVNNLPEEDILGAPDFEEGEAPSPDIDFEEPALSSETEEEEEGEAPAPTQRKGANILLLAVFVVLGLLLVGAAAYFIWRATEGSSRSATSQAPVAQTATQQTVTQQPAQQTATTTAQQPAAQQETQQPAAQQTATPPQTTTQTAPASTTTTAAAPATTTAAKPSATGKTVTYLIRRGDTLWDLAATYYRNPWLYPRLARANGIKNPDLIFAGTRIRIPQN